MKNYYCLLLMLLSFSFHMYGIEIKGTVIDARDKLPVFYANVSLLNTDSVELTNTQTTYKGRFTLSGDYAREDFLLKISFMGYESRFIKIRNLQENISIGTVEINEIAYEIGEVVVTGPQIIERVDRQIVFPTKMEMERSMNGFDLLSNMYFPGIHIHPVTRSMSTTSEELVQVRINGIKSTIEDVIALRAEDIIRIEYYDEPGLRFGDNIGAVLDVIVKRGKYYGGYLSVEAMNSPHIINGNEQVSLKSNYKASEFTFFYSIGYRKNTDNWTDMVETFNFADRQVTRYVDGLKKPSRSTWHNAGLTYNLTKTDNYVFNVSLKDRISEGYGNSGSNMYYSNDNSYTTSTGYGDGKSHSPSLDIYYRYQMENKQSFMANVVGTYINSDTENWYSEHEDETQMTYIHNIIDGKKYSLIGDFSYTKEFDNYVLSSGIKYAQSYTENVYSGTNASISKMNNSDTYFFLQLQGKITDKLGFSAGVGGSGIRYKEGQKTNSELLLRPILQLSYKLNNDLTARYSLDVRTFNPSLGQLSNIEQRVDSFRISRGNPDLKPYNSYRNRLRFNYKKGITNNEMAVYYEYQHKPYMNLSILEDDRIIVQPVNMKSYQDIGLSLSSRIVLIKDRWTMDGSVSYSYFKGIFYGFDYARSSWRGSGRTNILYNGFTFTTGYSSKFTRLRGPYLIYGTSDSYVEAAYRHKNARLTAGVWNIFQNPLKSKSKSLSDVYTYQRTSYSKDNGNMLYLRFSWNIHWGRKHKVEEKKMNNSDSDSGIVQ